MTGGELLLKLLKKEGVDTIFGYPGGVIIPIFDELSKRPDYFHFILPRHEQGAVHAADAYARANGKVGVCLVTSGPGATNTITGIANAYMDSIPIVVLSGQVPTSFIGTDAFQEVDMSGIVRPITKHRYLVNDIKDLPRIVKEAFYIASTGRPGPVVIDLPKDVTSDSINDNKIDLDIEINLRGYKPNVEGHHLQISRLAEAIKEAKKPIAYIGGGVKLSHATNELRAFLKKTNIPATTTLMALGTVDPNYKYSLDMLGMHGTVYANKSINNSDLVISIGARFDDRVTGTVDTFAPNAKIAHIDIDSASISKIIHVDIPVVGDAKNVLAQLNEIVEPGDYKEWQDEVLALKKEFPMDIPENSENKIRPQYVIKTLSDITEGKSYIATDVGQHQMWTAQYYKFSFENQFFTSGGLGTMGVGVPFGLGAAVALREKREPVIVISGDGSFQMNIQELGTISIENLPVKIFILNNTYLGMVRQWQQLFFDKHYSSTNLKANSENILICKGEEEELCERPYIPDFKKVAEAYRIKAERITKEEDVAEAIKRALEFDGPYLIDFMINEEENVFPMVPAGASLNEIIRGLA